MALTVGELLEILEGFDVDTEVRMMHQESYPFEYDIEHVAQRKDFEQDEREEEMKEMTTEERGEYLDYLAANPSEEKPNCVFLVEGRQLCYGNKKAWDYPIR